VLGEKAFEKLGKWFISLHFSDQLPGSYKKVLSFKFVLPDANNMADMTKLVALVPFYIDLIGRYKLSSHVSTICYSLLVHSDFQLRVLNFPVHADCRPARKLMPLGQRLLRRLSGSFRVSGRKPC
jgi:hypothetical protein